MNCIVKPWVPLRVTPNAYMPVPSAETLKIGVFPLASDPLQWNHLLTGLSAIAELGLDHVVYIVTEDADPSVPHLPQELRNTVTRSFLSHFSPMLLYSPLGAGYAEDATDALFRFIALNDRQPMEVYYIPGNAARRPEGSACRDITEEVEEGARKKTYGYDERSHPVSLVLSRKESAWMSCLMSYRHAFVDFPLPEARADEVLTALAENRSREALASLPYSVYEPVRRFLLREEMQPRLPLQMDKEAMRGFKLPA
jgi:hypothetical protein